MIEQGSKLKSVIFLSQFILCPLFCIAVITITRYSVETKTPFWDKLIF